MWDVCENWSVCAILFGHHGDTITTDYSFYAHIGNKLGNCFCLSESMQRIMFVFVNPKPAFQYWGTRCQKRSVNKRRYPSNRDLISACDSVTHLFWIFISACEFFTFFINKMLWIEKNLWMERNMNICIYTVDVNKLHGRCYMWNNRNGVWGEEYDKIPVILCVIDCRKNVSFIFVEFWNLKIS